MDIFLLAALIGLLTLLGFYIYDKKIHKTKSENSSKNDDKKEANASAKHIKSIEISFIDYSIYKLTIKEKLFYIIIGGTILYVIGYIFYQNVFISFFLSFGSLFYPRIRVKQLIAKRKEELTKQFKQMLYALASSVSVGKSIENAFREIVKDLKMLYPNPQTYIIQEIEMMNRKIENGETIEEALIHFSKRAGIDDISNFTDVFIISKRTGGDINEMIRKTSNIIGDKINIQQEIGVMIAQKKFESRILNIAPFIIVGLLSFSSPDYMASLYQFRTGGTFIMTVALMMLIMAIYISERIMKIKV